jgi:hypothetical protein
MISLLVEGTSPDRALALPGHAAVVEGRSAAAAASTDVAARAETAAVAARQQPEGSGGPRAGPAPQAAIAQPGTGPVPDVFQVAMGYLLRGLAVVPQLAGTKHPCVRWKPFQQRLPTEEELRVWFAHWPHAGLAVVLGPVSGLFAVDVDGPEGHAALLDKLGGEPRAPKVLSGSGQPHRFHLFFRHPDVPTLARFTPWDKRLEFRGDRGIIVLPPSLHKSGNAYRFAPGLSFDDLPLPDVPPLILEELVARSSRKGARPPGGPGANADMTSIAELPLTAVQRRARRYIARIPPAIEGQGGDRLTYVVACRLTLGFGLNVDQAMPLLCEYNLRCQPAWSQAELLHKLERASQEPGERGYLLHRERGEGVPALPRPGTPPAGPAGVNPGTPRLPALERVRDFGMVDPVRAKLFELIGGHGLFEGVGTWPAFDKLCAQARAGEHADLAAAVREAVRRKQGLIWKSTGGLDWAVRLVPAAEGPPCDEYLAVGFCLQTAGLLLGPEGERHTCRALSERPASPGAVPAADVRGQMSQVAKCLRLFRMARALLWYIHALALDRAHSPLLLADVGLAEVLWGAGPAAWPANWRQHLFATLASLTAIRVGHLSVAGEMIQPRLACAEGTLLSAVEDRRGRKDVEDRCSPDCTHWHSAGPHHHFVVTIEPEGFLGRLARCAVEGEGPDGRRHFNFYPDLRAKLREAKEVAERCSLADQIEDDAKRRKYLREEKRALKAERKAVRAQHRALFEGIVSTALLPLICGDRLGLTAGGRAVLRALTREVTRAAPNQRPPRQDRAHVFTEGRVPGTRTGSSFVCRLLAPSVGFIAFAANGTNWGRGYRLATWMRRSGLPVPEDKGGFRAGVRAFLQKVAGLAGLLGIVPVGVRGHEVFDLEQLRELVRLGQPRPLHTLRSLCLRLYVREDYLARWRQLAAAAVAGDAPGPEPGPEEGVVELRVAMRRAGVSQGELAAHLSRSRTYLNKLLNGKPWPEGLLAQARAFLAARGPRGRPVERVVTPLTVLPPGVTDLSPDRRAV